MPSDVKMMSKFLEDFGNISKKCKSHSILFSKEELISSFSANESTNKYSLLSIDFLR